MRAKRVSGFHKHKTLLKSDRKSRDAFYSKLLTNGMNQPDSESGAQLNETPEVFSVNGEALGETLSQHSLPHPQIFEVPRSAVSSVEASGHKSDFCEPQTHAEKGSK